jgi:hypothetical protein
MKEGVLLRHAEYAGDPLGVSLVLPTINKQRSSNKRLQDDPRMRRDVRRQKADIL